MLQEKRSNLSKRQFYSTVDEAYCGALDYYDGSFGQWINGLWGWTPKLSLEEQKQIFLLLIERLLQERKVVLSPPEEFWSRELGDYDTPMLPTEGFIGIWDIPIKDQIAYIRDHFPRSVTNADSTEITDFFYSDYCPRIGWIHPETGEIVAS